MTISFAPQHVHADTATSTLRFIPSYCRQFVPSDAVRFTSIDASCAVTSSVILAASHNFQMPRVDAVLDSTQMVNLHAVRNRTVGQLIVDPMNESVAFASASALHDGITATIQRGFPEPTAVDSIWSVNLGLDAIGERSQASWDH